MTYKKFYTITFKPNSSYLYYSLTGIKESFEFYSKQWDNVRLINSNGLDFIKVESLSLLEIKLRLNFCYDKNFEKLKFYEKSSKKNGYKVEAKLLNGNILNWTWKESLNPSNWILVDKSNKDKVLAEISGFTLTLEAKGDLIIPDDVNYEFEYAILATACLVWKLELEKKRLDGYNKLRGILMLTVG